MTIASSTDIFFDQLEDVRSATEQVIQTLPELQAWSSNNDLAAAFSQFQIVEAHLAKILEIFSAHGRQPTGDECKAIAGLIEGGNSHITMAADSMVRDHLLVAHSHRISYYLIAAHEFTLGMGLQCGFGDSADVLSELLVDWRDFDTALKAVGTSLGVTLGGNL